MRAEEKVAIAERGGLLVLGDKEYRSPLDGSVSLTVSDLTIHWRTGYDLEDNRVDAGAYSLSGLARLNNERVGIIGSPENRTRDLSVSLHSADLSNWKTGEGKIGHTVVLGFSRADIELRSQDRWWIEIHFPAETIEKIVASLRTGTLKSLSVVVRFAENNLFIEPRENFGRMAWDVRDVFLRPNKDTGAVDNPECAFGYEASVHLVEAPQSAPETQGREEPRHQEAETGAAPEADIKSTDIRALTTTVKVIGWTLVVLALLALFFK